VPIKASELYINKRGALLKDIQNGIALKAAISGKVKKLRSVVYNSTSSSSESEDIWCDQENVTADRQ
jgi:hypothetical protein